MVVSAVVVSALVLLGNGRFLTDKNELLSGVGMLSKKMLRLVHCSTAKCCDQLAKGFW